MRLLPNIIKTDDYFIAPPKNEYEKRGQRIVDKAKKQADKIIEEAEEKLAQAAETKQQSEIDAKKLLLDAKKDVEDLKAKTYSLAKSEGFEKGFKEGREKGFKQGYDEADKKFKSEVDGLIERLEQAVESVNNAREDAISQVDKMLPDIISAICLELMDYSVELDTVVIKSMIEKSLENYRNEEWINIYISNQIYAKIRQSKDEFLENVKAISPGAKVFPCRDFDKSDCVIEFKDQILDISAKTQLEKIKKALKR